MLKLSSYMFRLGPFFILGLSSIHVSIVHAFTPQYQQSTAGDPIYHGRWRTCSFPMKFEYCCGSGYTAPANGSTITESDFVTAVRESLAAWEGTMASQPVSFIPFTTEMRTSPPQEWDLSSGSSVPNGINSILFSSQIESGYGQDLDANVVGLTTTWFSANSGVVLETDIQLNDGSGGFKFLARDSSNPSATEPASNPQHAEKRINLRDVLTHELGHVLGLDHSQVVSSTMFPTASDGQRSVTGDDAVGLRHVYNVTDGYATVIGSVRDGSSFISGAHVVLMQMSASGSAVPVTFSAITYENGKFVVQGVPPGDYFVFVEEFQLGVFLGTYLASKITNLASTKFGFVPSTASGAVAAQTPLLISLDANTTTQWLDIDLGSLIANGQEPQHSMGSGNNSAANASAAQSGQAPGFRVVGQLGAGSDFYKISLSASETTLFARSFGYAAYTGVNPKIEIVEFSGATPSGCVVRSPISDTADDKGEGFHDGDVFCTGLVGGTDYYVKVSEGTGSLNCNSYNLGRDGATNLLCHGTAALPNLLAGIRTYALVTGALSGGAPYLDAVVDASGSLSSSAPAGMSATLGVPTPSTEDTSCVKETPDTVPADDGGCGCGTVGPYNHNDTPSALTLFILWSMIAGVFWRLRRRSFLL